jgi:hypothetical protein
MIEPFMAALVGYKISGFHPDQPSRTQPIADIVTTLTKRRFSARLASMEPPWDKYPQIPAGSIGWRMGPGEEYYNQFYRWFSALSRADQHEYSSAHEPPSGWKNIYEAIGQHPWS